jgi:hypothetical protein
MNERLRPRATGRIATWAWLLLLPAPAFATQDVIVLATDAIDLAGREDVTIPPLGGDLTSFPLQRPDVAPGQTLETRPNEVAVVGGAMLSFDASGEATFSPSDTAGGPDGDVAKDVVAVGGISGYVGPGGSLVGVFLTDAAPLAGPPAALDFSAAGIGIGFVSLAPAIGQVFFIGDGRSGTDKGRRQEFTAPAGATRLFLGTLDGSGVVAAPPGYYVDNDGQFDVVVPEPVRTASALAAAAALALVRRTRRPS